MSDDEYTYPNWAAWLLIPTVLVSVFITIFGIAFIVELIK